MTQDWKQLLQLRRLISRRLSLARMSLLIERLSAALCVPVFIIGIFIAVGLFDLLPLLPSIAHGLVLVAATSAILWSGYIGLSKFSWPTTLEARHALESSSGVDHRPLTAWEDNLSYKADRSQNRLWMAHRLRMRPLIERLKAPFPRSVFALRDHYALRSIVVILCVVGAISARDDIAPRFIRALNPALAADTGPVDVKVWLTPPAYTNRPPVLLDPAMEKASATAITVPVGTTALAVVTGTKRPTRLVVEDTVIELLSMDDSSLRYEGPLPSGERLDVRQSGKTLASWDLKPLADAPPTIAIAEPPQETGRSRLSIRYTAKDDYGITSVTARLERPFETRPYAKNWAKNFSISVPPLSTTEVNHHSFHDLTAHPWAGETVNLALTAKDAAGQTGASDTVEFRLPERSFSHLVAATIIQYRKDLINDPSTARMAARALSRLMEVPEGYGGDVIAHLAMASAKNRLNLQDATDVLDGVIDLMWQAAIRMEDGAMAVAEQALDAAEEALSEAIENGASPEEISRLIERLQRALVEYYQALAEKMPEGSFPLSDQGELQTMGSEDLAQMMEQLRELSQLGAEEAAKEMLADLRNMLETLRNAALSPMTNPDVEAARQMMEELKQITEEQSEMLNSSFEQARQRALQQNQEDSSDTTQSQPQSEQQGQEGETAQSDPSRAESGEGAAKEQDNLRQRLGDLMGRMAEMTGQVPGELGDADSSMRSAESALREESWRQASDAQAQALANLQSGMQGAAQQMMQALAEQGLAGLIPLPGQGGQPFGALGQNLGPDQEDDLELPTQPDTRGLSQRSREILDEIRRRAGQRLRPQEERQYLRRLLEQF
ncbi:MAG: TIGR02302 family protein [Rhodospirillaceae bacterium]